MWTKEIGNCLLLAGTGLWDDLIIFSRTVVSLCRLSKSRAVSSSGPHDGEVLQLAAYCLLVEEHFNQAMLRGQLQYRNRSIDIRFDDQLRRRLSNALDAMHEAEALRAVPRSHDSAARCRGWRPQFVKRTLELDFDNLCSNTIVRSANGAPKPSSFRD
jgi:hypothetical protein